MQFAAGDVFASVLLLVTLTPIFPMCRFPSTVNHHPTPHPPLNN